MAPSPVRAARRLLEARARLAVSKIPPRGRHPRAALPRARAGTHPATAAARRRPAQRKSRRLEQPARDKGGRAWAELRTGARLASAAGSTQAGRARAAKLARVPAALRLARARAERRLARARAAKPARVPVARRLGRAQAARPAVAAAGPPRAVPARPPAA